MRTNPPARNNKILGEQREEEKNQELADSCLSMIAVMTMNVGYFLSVLAGHFVGSVAFGWLMANPLAH